MTRPQSRAPNRSRWVKTPPRRVVSTWYVAMVTGRISLRSPEYSPISSSVSDVRAISSRFHCRPATVLVTRISVVADACGHRGRADQRLAGAAGQHDHAGAAGPEAARPPPAGTSAAPSRPRASAIACASPSTYPARSSAGQPSLSSACLSRPRSEGCTAMVSSSILVAEHPGELLALGDLDQHGPVEGAQHQAVGRVVDQLQPAVPVHRLGDVDQQRVRHRVAGEAAAGRRPRPRRRARRRGRSTAPAASAGTCARAPASAPARRTGRSPSGRRCASGWSTSSSRVLSDWTISGPPVTCRTSLWLAGRPASLPVLHAPRWRRSGDAESRRSGATERAPSCV